MLMINPASYIYRAAQVGQSPIAELLCVHQSLEFMPLIVYDVVMLIGREKYFYTMANDCCEKEIIVVACPVPV